MEADFSGWATKAGLECSDGRTIMPDAFKHQDKLKVPLVWQHGHANPENVLGHAILTMRDEGVWTEGFFNNTPSASHARELLLHDDINMLSIWANSLVERGKKVFHGAIREVSLVLAGANPGALIENVTIRHGDGLEDIMEDEVIIYTGLTIEHASVQDDASVSHEDNANEETLQDVFDSMSEKQQAVFAYAVDMAASGTLAQSDIPVSDAVLAHSDEVVEPDADAEPEVEVEADANAEPEVEADANAEPEVEADAAAEPDAEQDNDTDTPTEDSKGNDEMTHSNVFETGDNTPAMVISHADVEGIVGDAMKGGSLRDAVESYALQHGIQDIDILFPEARTLADSPELFSRRTEWVSSVMAKVRKSPFARIKTLSADLTVAEARAKGYVTGELKKEEFFKVSKRVTTPTTIYKKQKLDRDDMVDITDFDVVSWLKGEMRLMLDEELARAILIGDGRSGGDEDKINEDCIRPVATDHELYTTVVYVNLGDASSSIRELLDAIVTNRAKLRGSGTPTLYTTESVIAQIMLLRDTVGRRIYANLAEVADELRVDSIVPVEALEETPATKAILVNLADYVVGADKGGNVSMFDDFDIDYNQYKYLIETRASGALVKLKSALVVMATAAGAVLTVPNAPTFNTTTGVLTIVATTGIVYRNADTDAVLSTGAQTAIAAGATINVSAEPASTLYYISDSDADDWTFTRDA